MLPALSILGDVRSVCALSSAEDMGGFGWGNPRGKPRVKDPEFVALGVHAP